MKIVTGSDGSSAWRYQLVSPILRTYVCMGMGHLISNSMVRLCYYDVCLGSIHVRLVE